MLPFGGQGSNQALEDAGALGYLLDKVEKGNSVIRRIELFEIVRRKRASRVQVLSKVRVGKEQDVVEELLQYADDSSGSGKSFPLRYVEWNYILNLLEQCQDLLQNGMRTTMGEFSFLPFHQCF